MRPHRALSHERLRARDRSSGRAPRDGPAGDGIRARRGCTPPGTLPDAERARAASSRRRTATAGRGARRATIRSCSRPAALKPPVAHDDAHRARAERPAEHRDPQPFVELHPADAEAPRRRRRRALLRSARAAARRSHSRPRHAGDAARRRRSAPFHWGGSHRPPRAHALNSVTLASGRPRSRSKPELKRVRRCACGPLPARREGAGARAPGAALVIVGGGMAAAAPASTPSLRARPGPGSDRSSRPSPRPGYNRILLSTLLAGGSAASDEIAIAHDEAWYARAGCACARGVPAARLDLDARRSSSPTPASEIGYDRLVLATGSRPAVPPIEGCAARRARLPHAAGRPLDPRRDADRAARGRDRRRPARPRGRARARAARLRRDRRAPRCRT